MACTCNPDCKTTRRLDHGRMVPDFSSIKVPEVRPHFNSAAWRYGEFTSCSGYPEQYIKQNFIGVKCPPVRGCEMFGSGRAMEHILLVRGNYPKCSSSAHKPIPRSFRIAGVRISLRNSLKVWASELPVRIGIASTRGRILSVAAGTSA